MSQLFKDIKSEVQSFIKGNTLDALIPPLLYLIISRSYSILLASGIAIGFSLITFIIRIIRKQKWQYAIGGFLGVTIASGFAYFAGNVNNFFLPDLISGAFFFILSSVSLLIKKPLAAWVSHLTRGWTRSWFWRKDVLPAYQEVTLYWTVFFLLRLVVLVVVYLNGDPWILFVSNSILGFPATFVVLIFSYIYGIWRLRRLKGPGIDEYNEGTLPPWKGQTKGF
jgi:hypothetical protein